MMNNTKGAVEEMMGAETAGIKYSIVLLLPLQIWLQSWRVG